MAATTATRKPHTTPLGTGALHNALEASRDLARLHDFCAAHGCSVATVSSNGTSLDPLRVFDLMRSRGYQVTEPRKCSHQPNRANTVWKITVTTPSGASVQLGFSTPNTS